MARKSLIAKSGKEVLGKFDFGQYPSCALVVALLVILRVKFFMTDKLFGLMNLTETQVSLMIIFIVLC